MYRVVQDYLDNLEQAANKQQLCDALKNVAAGFDLNSVAYLAMPTMAGRQPRLITNYPEPWKKHYQAHRYETCDPVVLRSHRDPKSFEWGPEFGNDSAFARGFFDEAAQFGICYGITIPIRFWHGRLAAVTFATDHCSPAFRDCIRRHRLALEIIARTFHVQVHNKLDTWHPVAGELLTERERQCLIWAVRGKSFGDIAQILGIKPRTVRYHLDNVKTKFGVRTIREAVMLFAASNREI